MQKENSGSAPVDISVVMATYRRPALLARCLDALCAQTLASHRYEVIVVDDGHTDDTRGLVQSFASRRDAPVVRYLRPTGTRGPAGARNTGWRASHAPLIAFTDDDTEPDADWLRQGLAALDASDAAALCGALRVPTAAQPTDHARNTQGLERAEFVTANAFVRRDALVAVGGFDARYTRAWREDSDLQFSLLEAGYRVGKAPRAVVVHPVRPARWGSSISAQANSAFDALLYKKHPQWFRRMAGSTPPWHYHAVVLATLAAVAAAAVGAMLAAALLVAGIVAALLAFAAYRLRGAAHTVPHVGEMLVTSFVIPYLSVYWRLVGAWRYRVLFC